MTFETHVEVYRLHVWIRQISPMIWRRLLVRSDSTIADLHYALQMALVQIAKNSTPYGGVKEARVASFP
jgi:Plasmid pRiA4b ORF-3-like protein